MPSMMHFLLIFTLFTEVQCDSTDTGDRTLDSGTNGANSNGSPGSTDPAIINECSRKYDSDQSCTTFRSCCDSACDRLGRTSQPTCGTMRNGQIRLRCTCGSAKPVVSCGPCGGLPISTAAPKIPCGVPSMYSGEKIINGDDAVPYSWPWQISLEYKIGSDWEHKCGGSVIGASFVLTAAHCVRNRNADNIRVILGLYDRTQRNSAVIKGVNKIIRHEEYDNGGGRYNKNDIAILQVSDPIVFTDKIKPVCIAQRDAPNGTSCFATGWGVRDASDNSAEILLKQIQIPIVDRKVCAGASIVGTNIDDSMICAGAPRKDTCGGDSGGPLVCKNADGAWEQQGITSWGAKACGETDNPGVYARVPHFISWIYKNTGL